MLDQIRRDIQALLDELLGEIDRLRRALAALTSRESEPDRSGRAAPAGSAAGESVARSPRDASGRADTHSFGAAAAVGAGGRQLSRRSYSRADRAGRDQGCGPGRAKGRQRDDGRRDRGRYRTRPRDNKHDPLKARQIRRDHQGRSRLPDPT